MKKTLLVIICGMFMLPLIAQVKVEEGPSLNNPVENKMNRVIEGEEGFFYGYRIRTKGKGTSYIIEKYDKTTLKKVFSKPVVIPTEKTKVEDILFASGNIYVIYRSYVKASQTMTLYYKTVSSEGLVGRKGIEIMSRKTDHYEFIDFIITGDEEKTKFAVKCTHKPDKSTPYVTDFVLFDGETQQVSWTKTVDKYLKRSNPWFQFAFKSKEAIGLLGFHLENNGDIYYAYNEKVNKDDKKDKRYNPTVEILKVADQKPIVTKLDLNSEYLVYDLQFSVNSETNQLLIAGVFKDIVERKGRDLVDVGLFTYHINTNSGAVEEQALKIFDEKTLTALESNRKKARYMLYKIDYIIPHGEDFYVVGEQYQVRVADGNRNTISNIVAMASGANPFYVGNDFYYEYMDVIVAKVNPQGEFEWIANSPLRNQTVVPDNPHIFKQYIATASDAGIYLFYNEHPKNVERLKKPDYEPKDLKTQRYIHGSNMVYSLITPDGKLEHDVAFANEEYCFAPIQERNIQFMPPEDAEIFIESADGEIIIYLEDRGKSKFARVNFD